MAQSRVRSDDRQVKNLVCSQPDQSFFALTIEIRPIPTECDDWRHMLTNPPFARNAVQLPSM